MSTQIESPPIVTELPGGLTKVTRPEGDNGSRRRLGHWLKVCSEAVIRWLKGRLTRVSTYIVLLLLLLAGRHLWSRAITLTLVSMPPSLSQTELSPRELTQRLADKLDSLAQAARTGDGDGVFALESDTELPPIEVPGTGMTLPQLAEIASGALGISHRRTVWEISARPQPPATSKEAPAAARNQVWLMTAHLSGGRSHQVSFDPANPEPALSVIARDILGDVDPLILIRALLFSQDCDGARARANDYLHRALPKEEIARVYNMLGLAAECPFRDSEAGDDEHPNWGEAERYYLAAIKFDSQAVMPVVNLARMRVHRDYESPETAKGALRAFESAAKRAPKLADIHDAWGWSLFLLGDWEGAAMHADSAIRLDPSAAAPYKILGKASAELGKTPEAVQAFSLALARDPNDAATLMDYGHALMAIPDAAGASRAFARAFRADTGSIDAQFYLAEALRMAGRPKALDFYCRVLARSVPGDTYYDAANSGIVATPLGQAGCPTVPKTPRRRRQRRQMSTASGVAPAVVDRVTR
jgi:Tfp pilus assembly protein PilF